MWRDRLSFLLGLMKGNKSSFIGDIHPETVYRALVHRESKRSKRSGHLCRGLLIYRTNALEQVLPLGSELADKIISVLSMSVRDTDYVGWYRQDRILGVLFTALRPDSDRDGCDNLKTRLVERLHGVLAFTDDPSLQIRVLELDEPRALNAPDHPAWFPGSND